MATIGLYDIDFNHGQTFSISLPLMKAYKKLHEEDHVIIMMKPYENTGRYNKIFYFKNSQIKIPNSLTINTEKGKMIGYGFYGCANILEETALMPPDFTPYDMNIDRVKNKNLYKSIKSNSIVDWREKDFTGAKPNSVITYICDRDFLDEPDWEDVFNYFNNNISFIYTLHPKTKEQLFKIAGKNYSQNTRISSPILFNDNFLDEKEIKYLLDIKGVCFENNKINASQLFLFALYIKTFSNEKIRFSIEGVSEPFISKILKWARDTSRCSYVQFCKQTEGFDPMTPYHFTFNKQALYQDPTKITPTECLKEYWMLNH